MKNFSIRSMLMVSAIALAGAAAAETPWVAGTDSFPGAVRAGSRDVPVKPGDETSVNIQRAEAGALVSLLHGTELLTPEPLTIGEDGRLTIPLTAPIDAAIGLHPLTLVTQNPASTSTALLKLSEIVPPLNVDDWHSQTAPVGERAYWSALSADGKLFVASARGPNDGSRLLRLNADTLAVEAEAGIPKDSTGEQVGVFGVAVDDAHHRVWTTNTLARTVTVYDANDLSVVKMFPEGTVRHPRDVAIDAVRNRAYVADALTGFVEVFDTDSLEHVAQYAFFADAGREVFYTMDFALDAEGGRLYSVSRDSAWMGWVDLETGKTTSVEIPEAIGATDIARDPATGRLYVVSQDSDNLLVLDPEGKQLANTYIGAGAVSVVWNAATSQVFAATRAGGTVAVLDGDGKLLANIPADQTPNHLTAGPDGAVYLVAMYGTRGEDSQTGSVTKLTAAR
ncbi:MAG: hypothetical protein Q4G24_06920 [Paracoccus sp. (in: a-proteobacteria)]|uniref:hypothetical protein n=1 Tax=Paracoccus sp. TaxID=267 RepID=UPI0026DFD0AF|nr:hypothetical protein [Paracoccus sp. (in: a-proteobacteria)]MDO5621185.1 hypothetical protein [Paracoccus sp. (in: a-proteobacteria)]